MGGLEGKFHLMNRLYVYMIIGHSVYDYESGRFSKLVRCKYFMCLIKTSCLLFLELQFSHLQNNFKTNLFFSIMTPPTPSPNLSGHVHRLIIENKTKKGHNLVCWHQKNYPYHTEFVSWRVDHFSFFFIFQ